MEASAFHKTSPSDVSDTLWVVVARYLTLIRRDAPNVVTSCPWPNAVLDWYGGHTVVERTFTWARCYPQLGREYEQVPNTVAGLHVVAFACLMLLRLLTLAAQRPLEARDNDTPDTGVVAERRAGLAQ